MMDLKEGFNNTIRTDHFIFYFNDSPKREINNIARFSEGFISILKKEFFEPDFDYPIHVQVLPTRAEFKKFLRDQYRIQNPPDFGIYLNEYKLFVTYERSGLGTFAHEIIHPLAERNLPNLPQWAEEGIPSFFEKFFGYWNGNDLVLTFGYQNPWRINDLGDNIDKLELKTVLYQSRDYFGVSTNSEFRMVSVFLWRHGKLKRYLDLVRRGERAGYDTYFEAAFDMKLDKIEPQWRKYLEYTKQNRALIYMIPPSKVFRNKQEYNLFLKNNRLDILL